MIRINLNSRNENEAQNGSKIDFNSQVVSMYQNGVKNALRAILMKMRGCFLVTTEQLFVLIFSHNKQNVIDRILKSD